MRGKSVKPPDPISRQYAELQARSNQNRIEFLRTELGLSNTFAELAETESQSRNSEGAQSALAAAEKGYSTLTRFLADPKHAAHIPDDEKAKLKAGIDELRARLDRFKKAGKDG